MLRSATSAGTTSTKLLSPDSRRPFNAPYTRQPPSAVLPVQRHEAGSRCTDFGAVRAAYDRREVECVFCELPADRIVEENALAVVIEDEFPVAPLHTLVIPKRHVTDYFDLGAAEMKTCSDLFARARARIRGRDSTVAGFNLGVNVGEVGGQTIPHCHLHLIPRRPDDVPNPRGGVRHAIPGKGDYPRG